MALVTPSSLDGRDGSWTQQSALLALPPEASEDDLALCCHVVWHDGIIQMIWRCVVTEDAAACPNPSARFCACLYQVQSQCNLRTAQLQISRVQAMRL